MPDAPASNGSRVEDVLTGEPLAKGYRPTLPARAGWGSDGAYQPPVLRDVEAMMAHPRVGVCLGYYKSGIAGAKVEVEASAPQVEAFVRGQWERFFRCRDQIQHSYDYGWGGYEVLYVREKGYLQLKGLLDFHALDCFALSRDRGYTGVSVHNVDGQGAVRLWGPGWGRPSKALWFTHRQRFSQWYGRTQLWGAWRPWSRLARPDGAEESLDGGMYRFAYAGPEVGYPPGDTQTAPGKKRSNRDLAREWGEEIKAGAVGAIPTEAWPDGTPKWYLKWPDKVLDPAGAVAYCEYLEKQISLGIGVPPELIEASEVGSGWSGRAIPLEAFYVGQQSNLDAMIAAFAEQIAGPLVAWNFGPEAWYEVTGLPLLETRLKLTEGVQQGAREERYENRHAATVAGRQDLQQSGFQMAAGHDVSGEPRDEGGRWTAAVAAMRAAHPYPGPAPARPAGAGSPRYVEEHPEIAEAVRRSDEHTAAYQRWASAEHIHAHLNEPAPRLTPLPPPDAPLKLKVGRARRAIDDVSGFAGTVAHLGPAFAKHQAAVTAAHPEGPQALAAARREAARRYHAAVAIAEAHVAGLPEGMRGRARKHLERAKSAGGAGEAPPDRPFELATRDAEDADALALLRRALAAAAKLSARARRELLAAVGAVGPAEWLAAAAVVLARYRPLLARLLGGARLAALLAGMRRVGDRVPGFPAHALQGTQPTRLTRATGAAPAPPAQGPPAWELPEPPEGEGPPVRFPLIEEAVKSLREKQLLTRAEFDRLAAEARADAFTVAGVEEEVALGKVREALARNMADGIDERRFARDVDEALGEGTFLSEGHREVVFRTNVQSALSDGIDRLLAKPLVGSAFPYEETLPIRDGRLTELCDVTSRSGIGGTAVYRRDDPVWRRYKPPRHWNCRCSRSPLTIEQAARKGIDEAKRWLDTGEPPAVPAWVAEPAVPLPPGWRV